MDINTTSLIKNFWVFLDIELICLGSLLQDAKNSITTENTQDLEETESDVMYAHKAI